MSKSIGILGFVLFILGHDPATLYQFIGVSDFAMFLYRPRKDEFLQFVSEGRRRSGPSEA